MEDFLYGIDYANYFFYWIFDTFIGHSLIIRICAFFLTTCLFFYIALLLWIWRVNHLRKKRQRLGVRMYRQYYDKLLDISLDSRMLSHAEITARLQYNSRKRAKTEFTIRIIAILSEINTLYEGQINSHNYQELQTVFQITRFLERVIQFSRVDRKITALKAVESINCYVSEAVLVRILYHRNFKLRFNGRCAYLWLSQGDPFRFLNEDTTVNLTPWGMMNVHNGLVYRKKVKHNTLQLSKWLDTSIEDNTKGFIIKEIRLSNSVEDLPTVAEYVTAHNPCIRGDAITTLGAMKYRESAPLFMEMYAMQPEEVKRAIVTALGEIPSEQSETFLYNTYNKEDNILIRLSILRALYSEPDVGRKLFGELERQAGKDTCILFLHVKNPLIIHINPTI
ncbi:MAG: HEAT repeat domain-containing protein [Mediterranea sp.]|jgi:hypothetical protein|nr:HEAT repeat domain-containing protein [Mediterranea sp.]